MEASNPSEPKDWCPERFEIIELIGAGAMGKVYRASDQLLHRDVAIKFLNIETAGESGHERFLREAKALAVLDHPGIVRIFGSGINGEGQPYNVMEYLAGESLAKELTRGPLSPSQFIELASSIVAGLGHAHANKIAHRDLKPSNIIHGKDYEGKSAYKIIDFGIARYDDAASEPGAAALTRTSVVLGSPAYMSPEQCRGQRGDSLSDIYSLGCILYECINGAPPFTADGALELMYKHMNETPPLLGSDCKSPQAKRLASLVSRCINKIPDDRPKSAAEIAAELKEIFNDPSEISVLFRGRKSIPINNYLASLVVPLVAIAVLAAMFILSLPKSAPSKNAALPAKMDRVARDIETLKAKPKKTLDDLFALGRNQLKSHNSQDLAGAEQTYAEALQRCDLNSMYASRRAACLTLLGKAKWMQGKDAAAKDDFNEALRIATKVRPDHELLRDIWLERAIQLVRTNDFTTAFSDFKLATATGFDNSIGSLPDRLESIEELSQRLDKLGASRVEMFHMIMRELRSKRPSGDDQIVEIVRMGIEVSRLERMVAADFDEGKATALQNLRYFNMLIGKVKGHDDVKKQAYEALKHVEG